MLLLLFHLFLLQLDGIRDTTNSLNKIIIGIHAGNLFISTNNIIAASTNILSAIGSKNLPNVVIWFLARAIVPSNLSVIDAIIKMKLINHIYIGIPHISPGILKNGIITITGTSNIRKIVNLFGKFILTLSLFLYYSIPPIRILFINPIIYKNYKKRK
jgi:hypothetical protein